MQLAMPQSQALGGEGRSLPLSQVRVEFMYTHTHIYVCNTQTLDFNYGSHLSSIFVQS